jgi:hypothetical protein
VRDFTCPSFTCIDHCPRIENGDYYEAHQQLRVITSRYLKSSDYKSAADVLYNGALLLLKAGQGGSGGDLSMMLLNEVYNKGEYECNEENRRRLIEILHAFQKGEPTRKRFVQEAVNWSGKFGELERGDPELHHAIGKLFAEGASPLSLYTPILTPRQKEKPTTPNATSYWARPPRHPFSHRSTTTGTPLTPPTQQRCTPLDPSSPISCSATSPRRPPRSPNSPPF